MNFTIKLLLSSILAYHVLTSSVVAVRNSDDEIPPRSGIIIAAAAGDTLSQAPHIPTVEAEEVDNGYECLFDKGGPIPDPANPYQACPTTLSDSFLKRHEQDHSSYQFPIEGDGILVLGSYQVDQGMMLGRGDEGAVFLARHVPSETYVAAKRRVLCSGEEEKHAEYKHLRSLGQLYSAWGKAMWDGTTPYTHAFLIIPFVDGAELSRYHYNTPWITTTLSGNRLEISDVSAGMQLIRSMVAQLNYIAAKGAEHDTTASNILITNDFQEVVLIDFGYTGDLTDSSSTALTPLTPSKLCVNMYAFYCAYFLGAQNYFDQVQKGQIEGPSEIIEFLKVIPKGIVDPRRLYLDAFNTAFQKLDASITAHQAPGDVAVLPAEESS